MFFSRFMHLHTFGTFPDFPDFYEGWTSSTAVLNQFWTVLVHFRTKFLLINAIIFCCRYCRICVFGSFHFWDVTSHVGSGTKNLFRVFVQSFRLPRHFRFGFWSCLEPFQAKSRIFRTFCAQGSQVAEDLQSHSVSTFFNITKA